ncbi:MAG: metallophosphoesterase, partial [Candidatus Thermoplasmatota archaeon]|nr:metallophosphoesterase [Candidatus Thermoplasmatota archaeon]
LDDMHDAIISRWNERIDNSDTVYILGDLGFVSRSGPVISNVLRQLRGKKHLIRGNHDRAESNWYLKNRISSVSDEYILLKGTMLSHYPLAEDRFDGKRTREIKRSLRKTYLDNNCFFHYHAHTHRPPVSGSDFLNVGVDLHDLYPVQFLPELENDQDKGLLE